MFIDTHFHPYLAKNKTPSNNYENFLSTGGKKAIAIGVDHDSSLLCIEEAKNCSNIFASVGLHPCHIGFSGETLEYFLGVLSKKNDLTTIVGMFEDLYYKDKDSVVAIGECGLDYHWLESMASKMKVSEENLKELQKYYFKAQILLAQKLSLPFIIHNRKSGEDIWKILCEVGYGNFILHSFAENYSYAEKCIRKFPQCKISFSGIVTFKNAKDIQEAAAKIPLKHILIETDSPYLTPEPLRGREENEPAFTKHVLNKIIELRDEDPDVIEKQIYQNSIDIFGLED